MLPVACSLDYPATLMLENVHGSNCVRQFREVVLYAASEDHWDETRQFDARYRVERMSTQLLAFILEIVMKIYLPNSAHLQNIEGFLRSYSPNTGKTLQVSGHARYIHLHPFALAMAACAGAVATHQGLKTSGSVPNVSSAPYLVRMKLFDHLKVKPPRIIQEHEEAGRFVPITQIRTSDDLKETITNLVPLLHAAPSVADPIRYVISELGRNVLEHSRSPVGGFVCAQYFRDKRRIAIGMADAGTGIYNAIRRSHVATSEEASMKLALTPGISGATPKIGGNETNAGAGLFFIRSIAKVSSNFFVIYSGSTDYKLLRSQTSRNVLFGNPMQEDHSINTDLPSWQGTAVGIDINVDETAPFGALLEIIRKSYQIDVKAQKKQYFKSIQFT
jgi:anti-sigma regulatory factor (Ser/Thr protein kinase)